MPYEEYERLKTELSAKEKALAQMSEEYLLLKKDGLGLRGELTRTKISRAAQKCIIEVVQGLSELTITDACKVLRLARRRYRWLEDKPAAARAWNRITPKEEEAIVIAGRDEKLADLRAAGLMVYGHETGKFYCSISTIQRILIKNRLQAEYTVPTRKRAREAGYTSTYDRTKEGIQLRCDMILSYEQAPGCSYPDFGLRVA